MGLVVPQHVESSWARDQTHVPHIARRILKHWTTRKAQDVFFFNIYLHVFVWLHLASVAAGGILNLH